MAQVKTIRDIFAPAFWRTWNDIYYKRVASVSLSGGRGCVSGDTKIVTARGFMSIRDFKGGDVLALTDEGARFVPACRSIGYYKSRLFAVTLADGTRIECTDQHKFLTKRGWMSLGEMSEGERVFVSCSFADAFQDLSKEPFASPTTCDDLQEKHYVEHRQELHGDVHRLMRTLLGLIYRYWHDFRRCDGLLPTDGETYRDVFQRLVDAPVHIQDGLREDVLCISGKCNLSGKRGFRPSMTGCPHQTEDRCCADVEIQIARRLFGLLSAIFPSVQISQKSEDPDGSIRQVARLILSSTHQASDFPSGQVRSSLEAHSLQMLSDMLLRRVDDESFSDSFHNVDVISHAHLQEFAIKSIFEVGDKVFYDLFVPFYNNYISEGGIVNHNSTKSTFCADAIMLRMEMARRRALELKLSGDKNWRRQLTHAACFRKVGGTLADSCFSQFQWCASQLGLADKYIFRKTPLTIIRKGTGQRIYFRGLDDPLKARSIRTPFSWISDLWFEETSEFANIDEIQDVTRSIQRGGNEFMTYYSYNPPETSSNWVNYALARLEEEDPTFRRYTSDYRSVPKEWLGEKFFRDAEILRRIDERQYRHVYLGEITGNGGTVFPRVKAVEFTDRDISRFQNVRWGADFGLRDPSTLIGLNYDKTNQKVQIFSEWYKTDATLDEIEEGFKRNHFGYEYIYGDCAAGTLITTLRAHGLPMLPSEKGKGSILNGIKGLQSMVAIEIDKRRCPHTYWEFINMEYEKDKSGGFTGNIPPGNDHCIDPCVSGDTMVTVYAGVKFRQRRIADLVGTKGELMAYDEKSRKFVVTPYCNVRKTKSNAMTVRVVLDHPKELAWVDCTPDHRILTATRGWIEAGSLTVRDIVVTRQGAFSVSFIERNDNAEDVFDLEVPHYHNFVANGSIVVHNCRYALAKDLENFSPFG